MLKIGNVTLENNILLAPMAGVTDKAFRVITKPFGPGLMYTEMVSGKGLFYKDKKTAALLSTEDSEGVVAAQIFGHEPEVLAEIADRATDGGAVLVDINMGCPAPKIVGNGDGAALSKDPRLAAKIIGAVSKISKVPVTVKIRKGWNDESVNAVEMAKIAQECGAAAVTVHGRTREQFYSGSADWNIIREVKNAVKIPVIGNGDITSGADAAKMLRETGCDGVMIGRAAEGNPWIFREVSEYLAAGKVLPPPTAQERADIMMKHLELLIKFKGEYRGVQEARKHMAWYIKGIRGGAEMRVKINKASSPDEMTEIIRQVGDMNI